MNALAGLMNPAAVGQSITDSFNQGREAARQSHVRNALAAYAVNPSSDTAAALAPYDPKTAIELGQYEVKRGELERKNRMEAQKLDLTARAGQGDKTALLSLWGVDPDTAMKLDDRQQKAALDGYKFVSNAAFQIAQLPPDQQPAAWDSYIQQGVQMGYDGLAQYQGHYSPQLLNSVVSKAGEMEQFQKFQQPTYVPVGDGGLQGLQYGQPIQPGGQPPQQTQQAPQSNAPQILQQATARGFILPDEAEAVKAQLGPNGQGAFAGWLQQNKVKVATRTGTAADGRKVVQFEDGTVEYAD